MSTTPIMYEGFALFMDKSFDKNELEKFHREVERWVSTNPEEALSSLEGVSPSDLPKVYRRYVQALYKNLDIRKFTEDGHVNGYVVFTSGSYRLTTSDVFIRATPEERAQLEEFRQKFVPENTSGFYQWKNES